MPAALFVDEGSDDVDVFALEASGKPSVEALHAQILTPTEGESDAVKLQAEADPEGSPTSSYFQYGATSCAENPGACSDAPGTQDGDSFDGQSQTLELKDLAPGFYHYRVVTTVTAPPKAPNRPSPFSPRQAVSRTGGPSRWSPLPTSTARRSKR